MTVFSTRPGRTHPPDVNVVPFIDLLSALIAFLLLTAAWQANAALRATSHNAAAGAEAPAGPDPIHLHVGQGRVVLVDRGEERTVPLEGPALESALGQARVRMGQHGATRVTVHARDDLAHGELVRVLDACAAVGWDARITVE